MSEDNMNKNEETSALFVSTQKKKEAEEEARRRAEEEQAKREAAEAEVRRMEAEVEERKREVEEKKKAAEEAAAEAGKKAKTAGTDTKKAAGNNVIKFVGIGVAAVIVLIIIIAIAGSKKGSKIDFDNLVFDKEYMSSKEGYEVTIRYPGSLYSDVTEEDNGDKIDITFMPEDENIPAMNVSLANMQMSVPEMQAIPQTMAGVVNDKLVDYRDQGAVTEEKLCDISDENTEKYEYSANGIVPDTDATFAANAWLEPNRSGEVVVLCDMVFGLKDDEATKENVRKLNDAFYNENSSEAIKTPGNYPLEDINYDGHIVFGELALKIPVPSDRFKPLNEYETVWGDENGTMIFLDCNDNLDIETLLNGDTEYLAELKNYYTDQANEGLSDFDRLASNYTESRSFISESEAYAEWQQFDEFTTVKDGCKYWERDFFSVILADDVAANLCIVTYVPEKSKGSYKGMFDEALKKIAVME